MKSSFFLKKRKRPLLPDFIFDFLVNLSKFRYFRAFYYTYSLFGVFNMKIEKTGKVYVHVNVCKCNERWLNEGRSLTIDSRPQTLGKRRRCVSVIKDTRGHDLIIKIWNQVTGASL